MEKQTFEKAYGRLEIILDKLSRTSVPLEEAISLYEEADQLLKFCTKALDEGEKKIRILMKNQNKELLIDESGAPIMEDFSQKREQILQDHE